MTTTEELKTTVSPITGEPHMTVENFTTHKIIYPGVMVTTVDVTDAPTSDRPNRATFSDLTSAKKDDDTAVFLRNITETKRSEEGYAASVEFEADKLSAEEAAALLAKSDKKVVFAIHGFSTRISFHLLDCTYGNLKAKKVQIVPVCWPSNDKADLLNYRKDQEKSKEAGFALQKAMTGPMEQLGRKINASIICHSMGNRMFRYFANPAFNFDNIFLVAADIDGDIFHQGASKELQTQATNICSMLTEGSDGSKKGKVHVLFNEKDVRLRQSRFFLNIFDGKRAGSVGVKMEPPKGIWGRLFRGGAVVKEEMKDCVVNVNATEKGFLYDNASDHNYQFYDKTVEYYDENA